MTLFANNIHTKAPAKAGATFKEVMMIRTRLQYALQIWLGDRGFNFKNPQKPNYLSEDEIFSAAVELLGDMSEYGNVWCEEYPNSLKQSIKALVE